MQNFKSAFTMIEAVFVIVILGILAAIAIPKFTATRTDAVIAKGRSDVASIRTAISTERQKRFMKGDSSYISKLDHQIATPGEGVTIFDNNGTATSILLTYGITTKNTDGGWMKTAADTYKYKVVGVQNTFTYDSVDGTFQCTGGETYCDKLTK